MLSVSGDAVMRERQWWLASIGKRRLYSSGCLSRRSADELGGDDPKRDKEDEERKRREKKRLNK